MLQTMVSASAKLYSANASHGSLCP